MFILENPIPFAKLPPVTVPMKVSAFADWTPPLGALDCPSGIVQLTSTTGLELTINFTVMPGCIFETSAWKLSVFTLAPPIIESPWPIRVRAKMASPGFNTLSHGLPDATVITLTPLTPLVGPTVIPSIFWFPEGIAETEEEVIGAVGALSWLWLIILPGVKVIT